MSHLAQLVLGARKKGLVRGATPGQRDMLTVHWAFLLTILLFAFPSIAMAAEGAELERTPSVASFSLSAGEYGSGAKLVNAGNAPGTPPAIDIWYGTEQVFGQNGTPQQWINILGNASDPDGLNSLRYSLNGGARQRLSIGPDGRRLAARGDFNIDIAYAALQPGPNTIVITATDTLDTRSVKAVTVQYVDGTILPLPHSIDWSATNNMQSVAQVVDGLWTLEADSVRSSVFGYDRLIAIGDVAWDDYEVTAPITTHSTHSSYLSGVGFLLRWSGHTDDPISGWQPKTGWRPYGAIGWYTWRSGAPGARLQIWGNNDQVIAEDTSGRKLNLGTSYMFKMRVETDPGHGGIYSLKVWEEGQAEPSEWDLVASQTLSDPQNGSVVLIAHQVDASFGDVTVTPLEATLELDTIGSGLLDPAQGSHVYDFGEEVVLRAQAMPGWTFAGWSGDHASEDNPTTVVMDANKSVTATFTQDDYDVLVSIDGQGVVHNTPGNSYLYGQVATLEPVPETYWHFGGWSGPDANDLNDHGDGTWWLVMNRDKAVTATFAREERVLTVESTIGNGFVEPPVGSHVYYYGQVITLTVAPDPGWRFEGWLGASAGDLVKVQDNTWSLFMDHDKVVRARFRQGEYYVTVTHTGQGSVMHTPGNPYLYGQVATLEPIPAAGWIFDGWRGDDAGGLIDHGDGTWSLTVDSDKELAAAFATYRSLLPLVLHAR